MDGIPKLVALLGTGSPEGQRYAAGALWQLATSVETKNAIVEAAGIPAFVSLLGHSEQIGEAKESAAAVLSELARAQVRVGL